MKLNLNQSVGTLKGVGPALERKLAKLRVETIEDLIKHYPRRYDDFSKIIPIKDMRPGLVSFQAKVLRVGSRRAWRRPINITEALFSDGTGTIKAIWFNQPYLKNSIPVGAEVLVSGKLEFRRNDLALQAPAIEVVDQEHKDTARIVPVYPETEGLTSKQIRGLILPLVPQVKNISEIFPPEMLFQYGLLNRGEALAEIHFPTSPKLLDRARFRIGFEELFLLILAGLVIKQEIKTEPAPIISFQAEVARKLVKLLDFKLTDAQRRAAWEVLQDMEHDHPMNRLLQGDVGSGKTLVATMAAAMAIVNGFQAALMVPTEILARQHFARITPLLEKMNIKTELFLSKQTAFQRRSAREATASGAAQFLIGTHALLAGQVEFRKLGLVIVDEQHRFGVNQRLQLKQKAGSLPHLLSLTATPIPRSLALTIYGDLDISVIDQLPPGRKPVATKVIEPEKRQQMYKLIDAEIKKGRQVFVVCPLIAESDKLGVKSVMKETERLRQSIFKHRRLASLHGKMSSVEKQTVMEQFAKGKIDLLVATSVIEVGIDVPNASIMMIEDADRFGLAALHQLRGRVGRGRWQSYCFLLSDNPSPGTTERLNALERSNDGFRLAQIDLELRGPGQIYGLRQHGLLDLKMADLNNVELLASARKAAVNFSEQPASMLKYPYIIERVNQLKTVTSLD